MCSAGNKVTFSSDSANCASGLSCHIYFHWPISARARWVPVFTKRRNLQHGGYHCHWALWSANRFSSPVGFITRKYCVWVKVCLGFFRLEKGPVPLNGGIECFLNVKLRQKTLVNSQIRMFICKWGTFRIEGGFVFNFFLVARISRLVV